MDTNILTKLTEEIGNLKSRRAVGRVARAAHGLITLSGLGGVAALGDWVEIEARDGGVRAEIVDLSDAGVLALPDGAVEGIRLGDAAVLHGPPRIAPDDSWIGRIIDPYGKALDGRPIWRGAIEKPLRGLPPMATARRRLGERLGTGLAVFDTMLPVVRGQRLGVFSGSGVGKSSLLAALARGMEADVVVIALAGERGREVRDFVEETLGPEGLARAVVVVATSDQPPLTRRAALWSAMTVAEHFRDGGQHVLLLADSVTRFAEAHREIALAGGESSALRGFPPSTSHTVMSLAERAGPGPIDTGGDITAILTVLVAGSDMEEPIADLVRGVLDGHIVLDRKIAERGRFPAVDLMRSVSRSLPGAATSEENAMLRLARQRLAAYDRSELMIQSGLYAPGSDPELDAAISLFPKLDAFLAMPSPYGPEDVFSRLARILRSG